MSLKGWILYNNEYESLRNEAYETQRLVESAQELGMDVRAVKPEQIDIIVTMGGRKSILVEGEYHHLPDFLLPRMGSATTYYALAVIRHMERLGVRVFNSSQSVEMVKDKMYTQQMLALNNLPVPRTMLVKFPIDTDFVEKQLGFPVVVKTISGTQGVGVFLSENKDKFSDLMELMSAMRSTATILLQEFITDSHGRDLRVLVVGGRPVACMQRCSTDGNFKSNLSRGGEAKPYEMTPEIEWLATETARVLDLDIAGIDLLFDGEHFKICEANSSPGFKGMEHYVGVDIPREIYRFIQIRLGNFG
ncbi:MAG: RimK family alpha-L-glutamate ligase [Chloroflexi bacterium]|nr:RimK family alpha-L-glutamate ligase [Chloroflexota bacterium]